jgi:AhpD family alkylhydroperoxidase
MDTATQILDELRQPTKELRHETPDVWAAFGSLHREAFSDGEVPRRIKEAAALAMAVIARCDGCIASHARAAARAGATPAEVAELLGVALLMGGGPSSVYAPRAWEAYRDFAEAG